MCVCVYVNFEHGTASLRHILNTKKLSWLIDYITCEDPAGDGSIIAFSPTWSHINLYLCALSVWHRLRTLPHVSPQFEREMSTEWR